MAGRTQRRKLHLAAAISWGGHPAALLTVALGGAAAVHRPWAHACAWAWLASAAAPALALAVGGRVGLWRHPDLLERRERYLFLPGSLAGAWLARMAALAGPPSPLPYLFLGVVLWLAGSWLVTFAWKVSLHAGAAAGLAGAALAVFGPRALPVVAVPAAVGWSRVVLGRHDWAQVVAGWALGGAAALGALAIAPPPPWPF